MYYHHYYSLSSTSMLTCGVSFALLLMVDGGEVGELQGTVLLLLLLRGFALALHPHPFSHTHSHSLSLPPMAADQPHWLYTG